VGKEPIREAHVQYFIKPRTINLLRFRKLIDFGHAASMLYPREGDNPS